MVRPQSAATDVAPPPSQSSRASIDDVEGLRLAATEGVDDLFRTVRLGLLNPKRWSRLFLAAALRQEERFRVVREAAYVAVSLDDVEELARIKPEVSETLWSYWGFGLGLNARAVIRCRPELLKVLPRLHGVTFQSYERVAERRNAMTFRPPKGSEQDAHEAQKGRAIIRVVQEAFKKQSEIDLYILGRELDSHTKGDTPARGVNYGALDGDYAGWRPLHFVSGTVGAKSTAIKAATALLDAKADVALPDAAGSTAFHLAASLGHLHMVELLLERGALVEGLDNSGCSALLCAARSREASCVRAIVRWVALPEVAKTILDTEKESESQMFDPSASVEMQKTVARGDKKRVQFLVHKGDGMGNKLADVNFADSNGRRAVHIAAMNIGTDDGAVEMLRALVYLRADLDAREFKGGETPLHAAARMGRAPVVRTLLRLKAHPGLTDSKGQTPLMLAVAAPGDHREPTPYAGVPAGESAIWQDVEWVLKWNGKGNPPGPKVRAVADVATFAALFDTAGLRQKMANKFGKKGQKQAREANTEEEEESEDDGGMPPPPKSIAVVKPFITNDDILCMKALVLASLGWDDQQIVTADGTFSRLDRLRLHSLLFQKLRGSPKGAPLIPHGHRCRLYWKELTRPLLELYHKRALSGRVADLLNYSLVSIYGQKGHAFGELVLATVGTKERLLPHWDDIVELLESYEDLGERCQALVKLCFRGPNPYRQRFVGCTWAAGDFPREPDLAPWPALVYVSRDEAKLLLSRGGRPVPSEEAFKGNFFPLLDHGFDWGLVGGLSPPPDRKDMFQLGNRLRVDEALGELAMEDSCWDRAKAVGEYLLCPLLLEMTKGFTNEEAAATAAEHHELLMYIVDQMAGMNKMLSRPRAPYKETWANVKRIVLSALYEEVAPTMPSFRIVPPPWPENDPFRLEDGQAGLLPESDIRWLTKRHSSVAYIELLKMGVIGCSDEFNDMVVALAANAKSESFAECFWRSVFGLLVWARAHPLLVPLRKELTRRLHSVGDGVRVEGTRILRRDEVLCAAVQAGIAAVEEAEYRWKSKRRRQLAAIGGGECPSCKTIRKFEYIFCGNCGMKLPKVEASRNIMDEVDEPPLPSGFTDVLRATVVCEDEARFKAALSAILAPPPTPSRPRIEAWKRRMAADVERDATPLGINGKPKPGEEEIDFRVVSVISDFHGQRRKETLPLCQGVVLICCIGMDFIVKGRALRQLVEVEVVFKFTLQARWLAQTVGLSFLDQPPMHVIKRNKELTGEM